MLNTLISITHAPQKIPLDEFEEKNCTDTHQKLLDVFQSGMKDNLKIAEGLQLRVKYEEKRRELKAAACRITWLEGEVERLRGRLFEQEQKR